MKTSEKNIIEALKKFDKQSGVTESSLNELLSKYGHSIDYNFVLTSLKIKKYIEQEYDAKFSIHEFYKTNPNQVFPIADRLEAWNKFTRRCKLKMQSACPPYNLNRKDPIIPLTFIVLSSILFWQAIGFGYFIDTLEEVLSGRSSGSLKGKLFLCVIIFGLPGILTSIPIIIIANIANKWIFYPRIVFKTFEELIINYNPKRKNKDAKEALRQEILQR
ncbi:MAG: hypothetical protein AB8B69_26135 [Chitinophagales bacterium]